MTCSIASMLHRFYQDSASQQGTRSISQRAFNRIVIKWSYCTNSALSNHQTYRVVVVYAKFGLLFTKNYHRHVASLHYAHICSRMRIWSTHTDESHLIDTTDMLI
ncbi:unnamed protein product [Albugo candida]|uniref:Uncharacterized protein n=1 Tax=Albugo candida TaxID=65357 RepID=A0A024G2F4_9STRA|nr:unnamed protein product [Albugo candida]|eukprot:CCI41033.1 unnamed protein product [Albugo candida]